MNPNDLGKKFLVEECQKISISTLTENHRRKAREMLLMSEVEMAGIQLELATSKTGFGGVRYWFKCPLCNRRAGVVFQHPISGQIGCRLCLGLEYRQRRYRGMMEGRGMV